MRPFDVLFSGCAPVRVIASSMDDAINKAVLLLTAKGELVTTDLPSELFDDICK